MKKLFVLIFVLLLLSSNICVYATSNRYKLDQLELEVTIPDGYSVATRDTPKSDPVFDKFGVTKYELNSFFEDNKIYLNAVSNSYSEEIVVTNTKSKLNNFVLIDDAELNTMAKTLANEYKEYSVNVSKYEIYQHSQAKFIKVYFSDASKTVHGLQYYTIYDGNAMNFTMRSYEGYLSSRQEATIKSVVDSIKYDNPSPIGGQEENTDAFIYADEDSGVTFKVPANWKKEAFSQDREYIDVKFASTKVDGSIMIFGSTDIWEQMSSSDKIGYSREDINNSALTKYDIAAMYNTTSNEIFTVTYNGVQYFKCETVYSSEVDGEDVSVVMTQLIYIDNGWMYTFQYSGTSTDELYADFESLIETVQYPISSNTTQGDYLDNTNGNTNNDYGVIVTLVVPIVLIVILAFFVFRKNRAKKTTLSNQTSILEDYKSESSQSTEIIKCCKKCGVKLPLDSSFCHICGTKIDKE